MSFTVCQTFGRTFSEEPEKITGTRVYNVTSSTDVTNINDILAASGLPDIGDEWDSSLPILVVVSRTPIEVNKELAYYQVQINYETDDTLASWKVEIRTIKKNWAPQTTRAPWANAPAYPFDAGRYISPDGWNGNSSISGYPPLNRAGDPFEAPPKIDRYLQRIILSRTVADISDVGDSTITQLSDITDMLGTMNSTTIAIAGITGVQWTFLLDDIVCERIPRADGTYNTKIILQILYDKDQTHATPILNAGFRETYTMQDGSTGVRDCKNANGPVSKKPSLLDVNGSQILTRDLPPGGATPDGPPYYIVCPFYLEVEFGALDLPTTWT